VLDDSGQMATELRQQLAGVRVIQIRSAARYREVGGDVYEAQLSSAEGYGELIANLQEQEVTPKWIVCRAESSEVCSGIQEELNRGVYTLLHLTQALMSKKVSAVRLAWVYEGVAANAWMEGLAGMMKSIRKEHGGGAQRRGRQ
jgi:hypothetical protein